ncbi:MAG: Rpn family recombination-promoting nuclease/putative transposase [Treponema sp.]|jgi:predicted transposase/invertase (TIGR01784 family)|nr:Rpn family recombination-promoting nuclease/putative transposase [Treponema sp.]
MPVKRLKPLNDFAFQKVMGEKGDEKQLLAFLNAVLSPTGTGKLTGVRILQDKDLSPDVVGGKLGRLDVLAQLADRRWVNVEVQLKNEYNMEKRTLFYWASRYVRNFRSGDDYRDLLPVITINITGFECLLKVQDFHATFHLWEDHQKDFLLTDVCELHFLDMVKFRRYRREGKDFSLKNPLHRWLAYFDDNSSPELVEEVVKMDKAILLAQTKLEVIARNPELLRAYERYEKAASDWTSSINGARREGMQKGIQEGRKEGIQEGMQKGIQEGRKAGMQEGRKAGMQEGRKEEQREIARNLKKLGVAVEQIAQATGLSVKDIAQL